MTATFSAHAARPFLCCDYNNDKVSRVSAEGKIEWEFSLKHPQDCWALPNGNYLFAHATGAIEITPEKNVVWQFEDHEHFKTSNQVQMLDVPGDVTKGAILR